MGNIHYSALLKKNQNKKTITLLMPRDEYDLARKWAKEQGGIIGASIESEIEDYLVNVGDLKREDIERKRAGFVGD